MYIYTVLGALIYIEFNTVIAYLGFETLAQRFKSVLWNALTTTL